MGQISAIAFKTWTQTKRHACRTLVLNVLVPLFFMFIIIFTLPDDSPYSENVGFSSKEAGTLYTPGSNPLRLYTPSQAYFSNSSSLIDSDVLMVSLLNSTEFVSSSQFNSSSVLYVRVNHSDMASYLMNVSLSHLSQDYAVGFVFDEADFTNSYSRLNVTSVAYSSSDSNNAYMHFQSLGRLGTRAIANFSEVTPTESSIASKLSSLYFSTIREHSSIFRLFSLVASLSNLMSIIYYLQMITDTFYMTADIDSNMLELLRINGMSNRKYTIGQFLVLSAIKIPVILMNLYLYFSDSRPFARSLFAVVLLFSILVPMMMTALGAFFSALFKKGSLTTWVTVAFSFIAEIMFSTLYNQEDRVPYTIWYLAWFPPYLLAEMFQVLLFYSRWEHGHAMNWTDFSHPHSWVPFLCALLTIPLFLSLATALMTDGVTAFLRSLNPVSLMKQWKHSGTNRIFEVDPLSLPEDVRIMRNDAMAGGGALSVVDLFKEYPPTATSDAKLAAQAVSFDLKVGSPLALLGPNGSGKSTTINTVLGLTDRTSGRILIDGEDISEEHSTLRNKIGVCPQSNFFWESLTIEDHLQIIARLRSNPKDAIASVESVLRLVQLLEHRYKRAADLSGGMKRCLSLAMALVGSPKVLFLDEMCAGVSIEIRDQLFSLIKNISRRTAVLITTHILSEAEILADRVMIMQDSRPVCAGHIDELKARFETGRILIVHASLPVVAELQQQLFSLFPDSELLSTTESVLRVRLPSAVDLPTVFQKVRQLCEVDFADKLSSYVLQSMNLEHVFLQAVDSGVAHSSPDTCCVVLAEK